MSLQLGQVFRPRAIQAHVHLIISKPSVLGPVLVTNWTTLDEDCTDDACILNPGDHPAISHPSAIAYSRARLWQAQKIIMAIENGLLIELEPLAPAVLRRVIDGGGQSPELRPEWKAMLPKL